MLNDGTPDSSFSDDGLIVIDNAEVETGNEIITSGNGDIYVIGNSSNGCTSIIYCRKFLEDGTPDNSFGNNGQVVLDSAIANNTGWFILPNDDSSVIIGASVLIGVSNYPSLYKLLANGSKDPTFGVNGKIQM